MTGPDATGRPPVRVFRSADGLAAGSWDDLVGAKPTAQYGWVKTFEATTTTGVLPHYFTLGEDEQLLAVAIGCLATNPDQCERVIRPLLGRARVLKPALGRLLGPTLILGLNPLGGAPLLSRAETDPDATRKPLHQLCDAIEDYADERGWAIAFIGLTDRDRNLIEVLRQRQFGETFGYPTAELDIRWDSWDGYLASLSKGRRNVVRREIRVFEDAGCRVRRLEAGEPAPGEAFRMIQDHQLRINGRKPRYNDGLVTALQRNLGANARLYVAEQNGELLGFFAVLLKDTSAGAAFLGIASHAKTRNLFVYFNLAFYNLIREAADLGLRRIQYGAEVYKGKSLRGCSIVPTRIFLRARKRVLRTVFVPLLAVHRRWYGKKLRSNYTEPTD